MLALKGGGPEITSASHGEVGAWWEDWEDGGRGGVGGSRRLHVIHYVVAVIPGVGEVMRERRMLVSVVSDPAFCSFRFASQVVSDLWPVWFPIVVSDPGV